MASTMRLSLDMALVRRRALGEQPVDRARSPRGGVEEGAFVCCEDAHPILYIGGVIVDVIGRQAQMRAEYSGPDLGDIS